MIYTTYLWWFDGWFTHIIPQFWCWSMRGFTTLAATSWELAGAKDGLRRSNSCNLWSSPVAHRQFTVSIFPQKQTSAQKKKCSSRDKLFGWIMFLYFQKYHAHLGKTCSWNNPHLWNCFTPKTLSSVEEMHDFCEVTPKKKTEVPSNHIKKSLKSD